jgi:hypothetical protein
LAPRWRHFNRTSIMPIHINLLAEAQAAEEMRRHDPVKRAIFIGVSLGVVSLVWAGMERINTYLAQERFVRVETAINAQTNAYQHVESDRNKIETIQHRLAALKQLQAARFLQGNLLDALQHATVEGVRLVRLRVDQAYFPKEGTKPKTSGGHTVPGHPATVTEQIVVHLDARDYSANPGDQINNFKDAIANEPFFQAMLDKTNGVQLANPPSAPQSDGGKPYVLFTLDLRYPEVTR